MSKPSKSSRIQLVLELAQRKENTAMEALGRAKTYFNQQQQQKRMLDEYRTQYLADLKGSMTGRSSVTQLMSYQGFIKQLDQAIDQQLLVVKQAEGEFERCKQEWLSCHQKTKGMGDLVTKLQAMEAAQREKQIDKMLEDDFLARRRSNH
jgi:flagellar FliJ protein